MSSGDSSFPRPPKRRLDEAEADPPMRVAAEADEDPQDAASSVERPLPLRRRKAHDEVGQVVAFPRPVSVKRRRAELPEASPEPAEGAEREKRESREREDEKTVPRPTYLASELLRQDWYPRTPLCRTLRWGALALGIAGSAGTIAFGGTAFGPLVLAAILGTCALAGAVPFTPQQRGVALAALGLAGAAFAGWVRMAHDPAAPLLAFSVTLTASALFFRAAHRTSRLARILVGIGLATVTSWLVLTGGLEALMVETFAWQDVVGPIVRVVLGLALVCGVLTFLDPSGHGGAWVVGAALVGWFGLEVAATLATAVWPAHGTSSANIGSEAWIASFAHPFLAALAAGGLCQVWVLLSRPSSTAPQS